MFNFLTCDAFTCSLHSSTRNTVADWSWTTAWPERKLDGGVAQKLLHIQGLLHREVFTQWSFLHIEGFTLRSFCTQTSRSLYTQNSLHEEGLTERVFTHRRVCTQKLLHREAFTQRRFYTQKHLHTASFYTHRGFYTQELFTHRRFYTEKSLL